MSVKERLEDAQLLYQANRAQGALLSVLVAVAATARKRRPQTRTRPISDSRAFRSFVGEEMLAITAGAFQNWDVKFRGKEMALEQFLYKFLRCELAHEARLPTDVRFFPAERTGDLTVDIQPAHFGLSHSWMDGLSKVVKFAPENAAEFPDVAKVPDDVVKWFLFGKRRDSKHVPEYWQRRSDHEARWASGQSSPSGSEPSSSGRVAAATKRGSFDEIRRTHPSAYSRWTQSDDEKLKAEFAAGRKISELARKFGRQSTAIRSRLRKLGVPARHRDSRPDA